jgi:hypothetical protein
MKVACDIRLKDLDKSYKFSSDLISIEVWKKIYGPPKLRESQFWNFQDFNLGILGQNDIRVLALWPGTKNNIRGKWWLPPSSGHGESCESVFTRDEYVHKKCSNALTNLLFGLWRSVWIIDLLVTPPSPHLRAQAHPSTPKVLRARECAPILYSSVVFTFRCEVESTKEFGGASTCTKHFGSKPNVVTNGSGKIKNQCLGSQTISF